MDYVLSCCSTADLTKEHFQKRDISYICFHFELDGKQYLDDLGESMAFDKFYQSMVDGSLCVVTLKKTILIALVFLTQM